MVSWLGRRMFKEEEKKSEKEKKIDQIAGYFNAEFTKNHGRVNVHGQRIGIEKLEKLGVKIEKLENNQTLQTVVLTTYHFMTLIFERSPSIKFIASDRKRMWSKH